MAKLKKILLSGLIAAVPFALYHGAVYLVDSKTLEVQQILCLAYGAGYLASCYLAYILFMDN